jgi:hypothetical protein
VSHRSYWFKSKRLQQLANSNMNYDYDTTTITTVGFTQNNRAALQTLINNAAANGRGVYISQPHGIDTTGLTIPSNSNIRFIGNGALKLIGPYSTDTYNMLLIDTVSNVLIFNPKLYGSKELNTLTTGEYGMGINIRGACTNIGVYKPMIWDCWGDGIYIGSGNPSGLEIQSPRIYNVRRNGISVISTTGLTLSDVEVSNVIDTNPKAAIDFEPNSNADKLSGINVIGFRSIRCQNGLAFSFQNVPGATAQVIGINISGFEDYGCRDSAISYINLAKGTFSVSGSINITYPRYNHSNNIIYNPGWDNSVVVNITNPTTIA